MYKIKYLSWIIVLLCCITLVQADIDDFSPLAYWSWNVDFTDSGRAEKDTTPVGHASRVSGFTGYSIQLDGVSDSVDESNPNPIANVTDYCVWLDWDNTGADSTNFVINWGSSNLSNRLYKIQIEQSTKRMSVRFPYNNGGTYGESDWNNIYSVAPNKEHFICLQYNVSANIYKIYVNGTETNSTVGSGFPVISGEVAENGTDLFRIGGYFSTTTADYKGLIGDVMMFDENLQPSDFVQLFNNGSACPYVSGAWTCTSVPPVPAVGNESTEQTVKISQVGSVNIIGTGFSDIVNGQFDLDNASNVSVSFTTNVLNNLFDSSIECRTLLDNQSLSSTQQRSITASEYGSLYMTTEVDSLSSGTHDVRLQCRRSGSITTFTVNSSLGIVHILTDNLGEDIKHQDETFDFNLSSSSYTKLGEFNFTLTNNTLTDNLQKHVLLDGFVQYNYDSTGTISLYVDVNGTNFSEYPRYGTIGSTGIGGALITEPFVTNASDIVTFSIYGKSSTSDGSVNGTFVLKEIILHDDEVNTTPLSGNSLNNASFTEIVSMDISNENHASANLVVKAGIPYKATTGAAQTTFKLSVNSTDGTQIIRDVSTSNQAGIAIIQDEFNLGTGNYTIYIEGKTDSNIEIIGGDLTAYITSLVEFTPQVYNITLYDSFNSTTIQTFNATINNNILFQTTNGSITVPTTGTTDNVSIVTNLYDGIAFTNHDTTQNIDSAINLTLGRFVFNSSVKDYLGNVLSNYTVIATSLTDSNTYSVSTTNQDAILFVPKSDSYQINVIASGYASEAINITYDTNVSINVGDIFLYTFNSVRIEIYNFDNSSLIQNQQINLLTISSTASFTNVTSNGTIVIDFLTPDSYEIRFSTNNFNSISKFITVLNDSTQVLQVYMTSNATTELQQINVLDTSNKPVEGAIVWLQQEVTNSTTQWITIQQAQTDFAGTTTVFVERDTTIYYRFAVVYNGQSRPILPSGNTFTTKTTFIPGVTETITLVINTQEAEDTILEDRLQVSTNLTVEADNLTFNYTWFDAGSSISGARLLVYAKYINSSTDFVLVSNTTSSASFGSLTYVMTPINNTIYEAKGYTIYTNREELTDSMTWSFDISVFINKYTGLLYAIIIVMASALLTLRFGAFKSGIFITIVLFFLNFIHVLTVPIGMITGFGCLVVILFMEVTRDK